MKKIGCVNNSRESHINNFFNKVVKHNLVRSCFRFLESNNRVVTYFVSCSQDFLRIEIVQPLGPVHKLQHHTGVEWPLAEKCHRLSVGEKSWGRIIRLLEGQSAVCSALPKNILVSNLLYHRTALVLRTLKRKEQNS